MRDVGFHVGRKQLHVFPPITINSSHQQINIVLIKDGIYTLIDIIIIDLTRADLLPRSYTTQGFVVFDAVQAKERSYHD
jgi:hypothetical protein